MSKGDPDHVFCWIPLEKLVPVDESLRAEFLTKPDPSKLQVLSAANFHQNPVIRMIVAKCAALRRVPDCPPPAIESPTCFNDGCQNTASSACAKCKQVKYCSRGCQTKHWKKHKKGCKKFVAPTFDQASPQQFNLEAFKEVLGTMTFGVGN